MSCNEKKMYKDYDGGVSRRQWLISAGALAATTALAHFGGLLKPAEASGGPTEKWPWPYVKLDPTETAELAYKEWYRLYCGGAVISSIFTQLREKVGEPYLSFPIDAFVYLEGGTVGWGTICGSNAGASLVANVILGPRIIDAEGAENGHLIAADMLDWYGQQSMPVFVPKNSKIDPKNIPHTISESPLCHVSVGKWMAVANKPIGSPERKDRCARVAASVAYHLVELLNEWKDGKYESKSEWTPISTYGINAQQNCTECHSAGVPQAPMTKK